MNSTRHPLAHVFLLFAAIVFGAPLLLMALSSLKGPVQLASDPHSLWPESFHFENYSQAVASMPFLLFLKNSLILCAGCVAGTLFSCSLAAYGFARLRWQGRNVLFGILIATMLLPWHVTLIPRFVLLRELGFYNSLAALIVPTFLGDAFSIFLLRQFFLTIPEELSEAARIDGLGEFGIFRRIILPLSKPALATVALFQFVAAWNDFNGPLVYLRDAEKYPLAYGLERFVSSHADQTHLLLAASVLFTLPVMLLFFLAQKTFIRGIAATGLK